MLLPPCKKPLFVHHNKKRLHYVPYSGLRSIIPADSLRSRGCARHSGLLCTESIRATFDCLITVYHILNFIASTILFYKCTFNFWLLSLNYLGLVKQPSISSFQVKKASSSTISLPNVTVPVKDALSSASLFLADKTALLNRYHFFIVYCCFRAILGCSTFFMFLWVSLSLFCKGCCRASLAALVT